MKLTYDPRYNIAYLRLHEKTAQVETIRVSNELNVDIAPPRKAMKAKGERGKVKIRAAACPLRIFGRVAACKRPWKSSAAGCSAVARLPKIFGRVAVSIRP
jgi:hypothetical protein